MEIKKYKFGDMTAQYLINDNKRICLMLIPNNLTCKVKEAWEEPNSEFDPKSRYMHNWKIGSLAHLYSSDYELSSPGITMKNDMADDDFVFEFQVHEIENECDIVKTVLNNLKGYKVIHQLKYYNNRTGFEIETEFLNESKHDCNLQMLTSFSLDNLSPFQNNDAPNKYFLHRFYGGWSLEGKHICTSIEDLSLEKSWAGFYGANEKFGSVGSYPVERYFPTAVFEDRDQHVFWAVQIAHNSTWQMELTRTQDTLSFSGGVGDNDFCGWRKIVKPGERFNAPKAFVSVSMGDIEDACCKVVDMQKIAYLNYGEKGIPVTFNEFCSTWGHPTQEKMLKYCGILQKYNIRYAVIDAGWCKAGYSQGANGEWNVDTTIFQNIKEMNKQIRELGIIPGIWFEFEVTTRGSRMFESEYDYMHLKRNNNVIKNNNFRSYWDFRREDVKEYLHKKVIDFLKDNDFGYIKVDYNANIGRYIDNEFVGAEALREHMDAVRGFFREIKKEIPEIIIENCAAGGHRLEPSMLAISAISSFSDAHEAVEIPYIAANLHRLMLPAQCLIWCVLHKEDSRERTIYSLAATFLGRVCLSGDIDELNEEQDMLLDSALKFYRKLDNIIRNGKSKIYGNRGRNTRYPTGTQVVLRKTNDEMLIVCHAFKEPSDMIELEMPKNCQISDSFNAKTIILSDGKLVINKMDEFSAAAILLNVTQ